MKGREVFDKFVFKRGKKYEDIYQTLKANNVFNNMAEIFFFAASVGYKKKCKREFEAGIDMRGEHLSEESIAILYSMYINYLKEEKNSLDLVGNVDELCRFLKNDVAEYAEGGMELLCRTVFANTWDEKELSLRKDYGEYLEDITAFIKSETEELDF